MQYSAKRRARFGTSKRIPLAAKQVLDIPRSAGLKAEPCLFANHLKRQLDSRLPPQRRPQNLVFRNSLLQCRLQFRDIYGTFDSNHALRKLQGATFAFQPRAFLLG
jgi:hypothetical protein